MNIDNDKLIQRIDTLTKNQDKLITMDIDNDKLIQRIDTLTKNQDKLISSFSDLVKMMQDYGKLNIELSNSVRKEREEVEKISKDLSLKLDHLNYTNNKKCNKIENKVSVVMWSIPSILLLLVLILIFVI